MTQQPVKRTSVGANYLYALIGGAICVLVAVWLVLSNFPPTIGAIPCPAALLIAGVALFVVGFRRRSVLARVSTPEVTLSNQNPRAGEAVTLTYRQTFRTGTDVKDVRFQLRRRESATHSSGRSNTTDTFDTVLVEHQLPGQHFEAGQSIQEQYVFELPAMHTFHGSWNKVEWLIHVQVDLTGLPAFAEEYPLQVLPELAR